MKKVIALLLACLLIFGMAACSQEKPAEDVPAQNGPSADSPANEDKPADAPADEPAQQPSGELSYDFTIGYSVIGEGNDFLVTVNNGLREACEAKGVELLYAVDDRDAAKMKSAIDTFVLQGADIIVDFTVLAETGEVIAKSLDIPMISIDCMYNNAFFFGVNNKNAGEEIGAFATTWIADNWNNELDCVLMLYDEANGPDVKQRVSAAVDTLVANGLVSADKVTELNTNSAGSNTNDVAYIRSVVVDYLTTHPEDDNILIIAQTDETAGAANAAVESAGRKGDAVIVSHNCDANVVALLQQGDSSIIGTVNYNSAGYGEQVVEACAQILAAQANGETIDTNFYNKVFVVNADNVWEYYPEAVS